MLKLVKTCPSLNKVPEKPTGRMNPREWMHAKLGMYYVDPFLTDLYKWTDGLFPKDGSFDKSKLNIVRGYLIDKTNVPYPDWNMKYMTEVYLAWEAMRRQFPSNARRINEMEQFHDDTTNQQNEHK